MDPSSTIPIQKNVVLVGAGNAHLRFIKMLGMQPMRGVAITLVSEAATIPYSAMVPGHIAGDYTWDEITIDLVRLCRAVNVRFVPARAARIDTVNRKILFAARPELGYDVLSLGLGSSVTCALALAGSEWSWPMRPLAGLLDRLNALEQRLRQTPAPFHLAIVGGGASGCELTLAIRKRFSSVPNFRITLLQANARLLPQFPAKAANLFADLMQQQSVTVRCSAQVTGGDGKTLELNGADRFDCDAVLWATNAAAPDLLRASGMRLNPDGFLLVNDTLQSQTDLAIFGTGDCIAFQAYPDLLKNGVYAVRQGAILFVNVARFLNDRPLVPFRPQQRCLCLLNTSDGDAIFTYGPIAWKGRLARRLKERVDRAWMEKFTRLQPMNAPAADEDESAQMRCGGCGNKISADVLSAVLKRIDVGDDPRILLGVRAGEDAAVHRVRPELFGPDPARLVEVQTVDYFKTFLDDPYLFGRIAAISAVSDLYAMNARPFSALAIATLPYARGSVQEAMLYELLSGAVESLRHLGVVLTGGHTTEGTDLALGFALTGFAEEDRLFRKSKMQPGDLLILTKPLGSGALLAAWMRGQCSARWYNRLIASMLVANDRAAAIFAKYGVQACTDVTGFGLAGHLLEMLDASNVSAHLQAAKICVFDGFNEVAERGIVSTLHSDNAKASCRVQGPSPWLFDPQTSGGLLAAVKPEVANEVLRLLIESGCADAAIVGEVVALAPGETPLIRVI